MCVTDRGFPGKVYESGVKLLPPPFPFLFSREALPLYSAKRRPHTTEVVHEPGSGEKPQSKHTVDCYSACPIAMMHLTAITFEN